MLQFLTVVFVAFVVYKTTARYKKGDITNREYYSWLVFWLVVLTATLTPHTTDTVARLVGVERGADLLFFISILFLFFIVFKIVIKLEKIDRDITAVVRRTAIDKRQDKQQKDE